MAFLTKVTQGKKIINFTYIAYIKYVAYITRLYNNCAMNAKKNSTLNLRVDPLVKDAVRYAANQERRSVTNMVEMMIRQYWRDAGYPVLEQNQLFDDAQ